MAVGIGRGRGGIFTPIAGNAGTPPRPSGGRRRRPFVEALEERRLLATFLVTNTNDSGAGSLRQAILNANADSTADNVWFRIPASTAPLLDVPVSGFDPSTREWTIQLVSPLPTITSPVWIDGFTQGNGAGVPYRYPAGISSSVQSLSVTGSPTGGSLTLTTAAPLPVGTITVPYDATAATVQAALGGLIGNGNVAVTGGPGPDASFSISFQGIYAHEDIPDLIGNGAGLTGGTSPGVLVQTTTAGGVATTTPTLITSSPSTLAATSGNNAVYTVVIDGSGLSGATGFTLQASHSNLRGLVIEGFDVGVHVLATDTLSQPIVGDLIQGNAIGDHRYFAYDSQTGEALTNSQVYNRYGGNRLQGVILDSQNTTVGGVNPQESNVICGNGAQGIWVTANAMGNQILNNQVGLFGPDQSGFYVSDGNGAEGILVESSSNQINDNLVSANAGAGIHLAGISSFRNVIVGNFVGVAAAGGYGLGTGNPGNIGDGILLEDSGWNQIGGPDASDGNTIASNGGAGVYITGTSATGNVVENNRIGVTADGDQVLGNALEGVAIYSSNNTIGPGNVISQNMLGIGIYGPGAYSTLVQDNLIGSDSTGKKAGFGNAIQGILIKDSSGNTINGTTPGSQVISGNHVGVEISGTGSTGNLLTGNIIGTDTTGAAVLKNSGVGVLISGAASNTIGGSTTAALNLISANHVGIQVDGSGATGNLIAGNNIGTDITGTLGKTGNETVGVLFTTNASHNTVGGTVAEFGNKIAFNRTGVEVDSGIGNSILTNSIWSNTLIGIDLVAAGDPATGITPNAPGVRSGPNNLQNSPVLTTAVGGGTVGSVQGSLNSLASTTFLIQFFSNPSQGLGGYGQGKTYLGSMTVTTDASGNASFVFTTSTTLTTTSWIAATATNLTTGDTSEFSNDVVPAPVSVQLATATTTVTATSGLMIVHVIRSGNTAALVSVNYATADGTGVRGKDYTATSGTLTFQPGETDKTFTIPILNNVKQTAASVTFRIVLSAATNGATIGTIGTETVTITNSLPHSLTNVFYVTNTADSGDGSLREAILDANAAGSPADIWFAIPASTAAGLDVPVSGFDPLTHEWTITLATPLPVITNTVWIDGFTQGTGTGVPYQYPSASSVAYIRSSPNTFLATTGNDVIHTVVLDGSGLTGATGLTLQSSHSTVRGLVIQGFDVGIHVLPTDISGRPVVGDLIQGNAIGNHRYFLYAFDTGSKQPVEGYTSGLGNTLQGIILDSTNTTVGGWNAQENNVICGNGAQGILVTPGASGNQIISNQIGIFGPDQSTYYVYDGNGAEGIKVVSSGSASDPANIVFTSSIQIAGNEICTNNGAGVRLVGVGAIRNLIESNYIGVAPPGGYRFGTGDPGNIGDGVRIEDAGWNNIGGSSSAKGNIIASNRGAGVYITGASAVGNTIANNMIGVVFNDSMEPGRQVLGNMYEGVALYSPSNTIGPGNVISQNFLGIGIYGPGAYGDRAYDPETGLDEAYGPGATNILVKDNLIGTDAQGVYFGFGNARQGILIVDSSANTISGNAAGSQVISGNKWGVEIRGNLSTKNLLTGNFIGSDITGEADLGNKAEGVLITDAPGNTIGGTTSAAMNLISANHYGIHLDGSFATGNLVAGNLIGTDLTGAAALGNEVLGVWFTNSASLNTVGGTVSGSGNKIAFHRLAGVEIDSGTGDSILSNDIWANNRIGIDLVAPGDPATGVTPNAPGIRSGPNNLQNAPVLTTAVGGGTVSSIQGSLNSLPGITFLIQFFTSLVPDPSGYGQGQTYIGSMTVTTDGAGNASFGYAPLNSLATTDWVTATATNIGTGDTSEFSNSQAVLPVSVQMATATMTVDADAGSMIVHVLRTGNPNALVSVNYATANGTAIAGKDYTATAGILTFQPGEMDRTFVVPILANPNQTASSVGFQVAISNPTGGSTLGSITSTAITIDNNLPAILQFSKSTYTASNSAPTATITVVRSGGNRSGTVQVSYATAGGTGVAGVDYTPVSGTLTFLANQTTATISVPLLHPSSTTTNVTVGLSLGGATGGAVVGTLGTTELTISSGGGGGGGGGGNIPAGPPPQITGQRLVFGPWGVAGVVYTFSKGLDPARAADLGNYGYYAMTAGPDGSFATPDDGSIRLASATYDPASLSVTLVPATPFPTGTFIQIVIDGMANPLLNRGITDTSGTLLSGAGNGVPGGAFVTTFAVGPNLTYTDSTGVRVNLNLTKGGTIEAFRSATGDVQSITLLGTTPRKSILTLTASRRGRGITYLPPIQGAAGVRLRYRPSASTFRHTPAALARNAGK
ncbi:Calx-beta domain-containing protein [Aquisphaera insulae]|uniref:Calx-beta domain-containing protein n=1 Tax=Aquisphaera insulae TaxID=2712864 RepID=UPI0013EB0844|nr:Calx-beta domain-containing protein [Aquisphaera insulae]